MRTVLDRFGRIDALVNAAGTIRKLPTIEMSLDDWEAVLRTNLTGTFLACQACGRIMREQRGGAIVNIASLTSFVAFADVAAYGVSKAGVAHLTQSLANDWASYGIRVNAIAPGVFPTLTRPLIENTARGEWLREHTPCARFGEPNEVVGAAIYLISPASKFVTGTVLVVDGGLPRSRRRHSIGLKMALGKIRPSNTDLWLRARLLFGDRSDVRWIAGGRKAGQEDDGWATGAGRSLSPPR